MKTSKIFILSLTLIFSIVSCDDDSNNTNNQDFDIVEQGRAPAEYTGPLTRILEDNVHATKQNTTYQLTETDYLYSHMYAFRRVFTHMNKNGYEHDRLVGGKLTAELLASYDILFINLMDESKPYFTEEEQTAVEQFVFNGGGLFVIADHTNVYDHADKMNPLLQPFGITIRYEICVDVSPHTVAGLGWILVSDLTEHVVNEGLHEYSLQTGAPIDGPGGIGFTSPNGWGDAWDPEMAGGYYGNWAKDADEVSGPQAVVQAVSYGSGGVFVAGDQNMFGDPYVWFIDNGGLALNAFEWLAHREDEEPALRTRPVDGLNIHIDTRADNLSMGQSGSSDHYTFYTNMNRVAAINAHASRYPLYFRPDVSMVVDPSTIPDASSLAEMEEVVDNSGQVVLVINPSSISTASRDFISYWGLDLGLQDTNGNSIDLTDDSTSITELQNITTIETLRDRHLELKLCGAIQCPGHAVVSAVDETETQCDLICEYDLENGRFLLVLTGHHFTRSTMGDVHDVPKTDHEADIYTEDNYFLQLGLTDILLQY
jgi:hypothetical protein